LVITLDDGCSLNARLLEIIRKRRLPVVTYVVAGVVGTTRKLWFEVLPRKGKALSTLKAVPDAERRRILEEKYGHTDERQYGEASGLSVEELRALLAEGASVGSHSMFHPILTRCSDRVGEFELRESKRALEEHCGQAVLHFAYPGGEWDDRVRVLTMRAGYKTARTIDPGRVTPKSDPFALPDYGIADDAGLNKAIVQASGLWAMLLGLWAHLPLGTGPHRDLRR
jgi:peptidoglycan/xylan/chitin deacetylase (PgdA/CDA1 family)